VIAAILLAAGESRRMGFPKPLLKWGSETLVEYQARQLREAGADPIIIVLGFEADDVRPLIREHQIVVNPRYAEGRATSVRAGAVEVPDDTAAVVVLSVDEPRPSYVLRRLIDEHATHGALITFPTHNDERGHPPVFDGSLLPELRRVRDETEGIRGLQQLHEGEILEVEFDSPVVLTGMNTPEEYEQAKIYFEKVVP
jgi:molybdenum cofactor cytidylyltransferase